VASLAGVLVDADFCDVFAVC